MTVLNEDYTQFFPSTAWMPLDQLAEQWGQFASANITHRSALQATSAVFRALAQETEARAYHLSADHAACDLTVTELEVTLEALRRALISWSDAFTALRLLPHSPSRNFAPDDTVSCMVLQVMQQRLRLSALIQEVEQEQLMCYSRKGGEMVVLPHRSQQ